MISPTPDRVVITKRAVIAAPDWSLVDTNELLYGQLGVPVGGSNLGSPKRRSTRPVGGGGSISPRWKYATWLRYSDDAIIAGPPGPGSQLTIDNVPYEVSDDPSFLSQGTRAVGWELSVVEIALAYPTACSILDSAGDVVAEANIAKWSPSESHDDRGERVDEEGEAAGTMFPLLVPRNTVIQVGAEKWRITSCTFDLDLGRVSLRLRNTRGGE